MTTILDEIFAHKRREVAQSRQHRPLQQVQAEAAEAPTSLDFIAALRLADGSLRLAPAVIAEIKRASPSRGLLAPHLDPVALSRLYRANGAAAISVLTDERYFQGRLDFLSQIAADRTANDLPRVPLLRKDFICDPYQIYEARAAGADAVLLIVAGLVAPLLAELHALTAELGMAALVEVHSAEELETALALRPRLVGINNRDLRDFTVSLDTTLRLRPLVPPGVCLVAESGIHTGEDVTRLAEGGVDAILVGEALVTAEDIAGQVRQLSGQAVRL